MIVLLEDDGSVALLAREDADVEDRQTVDGTRRTARVTGGDGEPLSGGADRVYAAIAAEVVGLSQRALDMTLEYVKERKQFGVAGRLVPGRGPPLRGDAALHRGDPVDGVLRRLGGRRRPGAAARGGGAGRRGGGRRRREVTASAIQAHGGIGFTWEADVHWMYKRAQLDAELFGGAGRHRRTLARVGAERVAAPAAA